MAVGTALTVAQVNPIKLLVWSAVVNGLLAPPLVAIILAVCNNRSVMGTHRNSPGLNILGGIAGAIITAAGVALVWSWVA